jgi:hypothetical protein
MIASRYGFDAMGNREAPMQKHGTWASTIGVIFLVMALANLLQWFVR